MISESLGFGKFIYFSQKLETYFSEKIVGRLQRFRTKKSENNMKLQQNMRMCFVCLFVFAAVAVVAAVVVGGGCGCGCVFCCFS